MNGQRKPRRVRFHPIVNAIEFVTARTGKLTTSEVVTLLTPIHAAHTALREGVATQLQWAIVAGAVELALGIERMGKVRGMHEHFKSAESALQAIKIRATAASEWKPTALHWQELDAIGAAVGLHKYQLKQISFGEFQAVTNRAIAEMACNEGLVLHMDRQPQIHTASA